MSQEATQLPAGKSEEIQHLAKRVYRVLGLNGYARIDLRMAPGGQLYVLEANPNPQPGKISLIRRSMSDISMRNYCRNS